MSHVTREMLTDCSTPTEFCFSVRCAECGRVWKSRKISFSKAGLKPENESKRVIYEALYKREKQYAQDRAVRQAEEIFSQCPICGRLVCDECFLICGDLDLCASCAQKLGEKGTPVGEGVPCMCVGSG